VGSDVLEIFNLFVIIMNMDKNLFKNIFVVIVFVAFAMACTNTRKSGDFETEQQQDTVRSFTGFTGNYVSPEYFKRNEGYDWVAVLVNQTSIDKLSVMVRSRADKKKPTCLLDFEAFQIKDSMYYTVIDGKKVNVNFRDSEISIAPEKKEGEAILFFYCSGGATVAGTYSKIDEPLDSQQIDRTSFARILNLQNVGFNITSINKAKSCVLTIDPFGLSLENNTVNITFQGHVANAEVEDLDSDGYPELLVYTYSGENRVGNVFGYSIENQTQMQAIEFPKLSENPDINNGYNGLDEFTIIETSLARRFPIFENGEYTRKMKQIQYKLEKNDTNKKFVVVNVTEY